MIDKKIHYCWFGRKKLPKDVKECIKSWKKKCPDYEIIRWDETNFDINCNNFVKEAYRAKAWAFVSDYARLKIIYENGGIYLDTDVELLKNLDFLLENDFFIGTQQCENVYATGLGFGATKNNHVVKKMLDEYDNISFDNMKKELIACPYLNTSALKRIGFSEVDKIQEIDNCVVYPPKYFDPLSPGPYPNLLCDDTVSIHHYTASWTNPINKLKRKIINIIGQDKINNLKKRMQ